MALYAKEQRLKAWNSREKNGTIRLLVANASKQQDGSYDNDFRAWAFVSKNSASVFNGVTLPTQDNGVCLRLTADVIHTAKWDKENQKEILVYRLVNVTLDDAPVAPPADEADDDPF